MNTLSVRIRRLTALGACAGAIFGVSLAATSSALADTTDNYACTGGSQTSSVPSGDNEAIVTLNGASGGSTLNNGVSVSGGAGEQLVADVPVTAGSQLDVIVGCQGADASGGDGGAGGFGGGGNGGNGDSGEDGPLSGGAGGGASYILPASSSFGSLYAIAGGGGGAGGTGGFEPGSVNGAGGAGASAGANGSTGGDDTDPTDPQAVPGDGGGGGTAGNLGGQGGAASGRFGSSDGPGATGITGLGGHGGNYDSYEGGAGGGGGGGLTGGGGGGYGYGGNDFGAGGGGGGGGDGAALNGATLVSANDSANTGDGSVSITYTVAADISVSPSSYDFGAQTANLGSDTESFQVTDTGEQPLNIGQAGLTGADAGQFTIVSGQDNCSGQTVSGGNTCTIEVAFAPTNTGARTAALSIPSDATSGTATVGLSGTGQTAATPPTPTPPTPTPPAPTPRAPGPTPAPKLIEHLVTVGTPTAQQSFTHGEKVAVSCNEGCSVDVTLEVYHRAAARGKHYRGELDADMAVNPWTRVTVSETVVMMSQAGTKTVYVKLSPAAKKVLSYAGSILLGVYTQPAGGRGTVSKRWVTMKGPNMNAWVAQHQHGG
jgi:hypothetical protein